MIGALAYPEEGMMVLGFKRGDLFLLLRHVVGFFIYTCYPKLFTSIYSVLTNLYGNCGAPHAISQLGQ